MNVEQFTSWLTVIIGMGLALAVLVSPLVAVIKRAANSHLPARYYPTVALAVGIVLGLFVGPRVGVDWQESLLIGAVAGYSAAKLFEYGKNKEDERAALGMAQQSMKSLVGMLSSGLESKE